MMDFPGRFIIVGSGFFGCVFAERIASALNEPVLVLEKRNHIGGNCFSEPDKVTGIECHVYGSHIFHTSNKKVWDYINRFCSLNSYRHKVLTKHTNKVYQMPINLDTINSFYSKMLTPEEAKKLIQLEISKEYIENPANLEEKAISLIGRPLYDALIREYTLKQWGTDPRELPANIITRLPVRFNYKSDYFNDTWQGIPVEGYQAVFQKMLDHPNIEVRLNTDFFSIRHLLPKNCRIIYSGAIDQFFDYRFGPLGWRTIELEKEVCNVGDFQGTAVMNYADGSIPFTRIHEFRHYHEDRYPADKTVIYREYSKSAAAYNTPYYPIATAGDKIKLDLYMREAAKLEDVTFGGRLGNYKYVDMDKTIGDALEIFEASYPRWKNSAAPVVGL